MMLDADCKSQYNKTIYAENDKLPLGEKRD